MLTDPSRRYVHWPPRNRTGPAHPDRRAAPSPPARILAASLGSALAALALLAAAPASANPPTPITDCASTAGLRAAVAVGGSYAFTCSGTIHFAAGEAEIVVDKPVSIDASGPNVVDINANGAAGRIFNVTAGTLTLTGGTGHNLTLEGGALKPLNGANGGAGTAGAPGPDGATPGAPGQPGGNGGGGQDGAAAGSAQQGGCIYVASAAGVTLQGLSIHDCFANGSSGGSGGPGGTGGAGGAGQSDILSGGDGGIAGGGGGGGAGASGSDGAGGAIYNAGTLTIGDTAFSFDSAVGGNGGDGGHSGIGGIGGNAGTGTGNSSGTIPGTHNGNGGSGGGASGGGRAGSAGAGKGGAIYNAGQLTVNGGSFDHNTAETGIRGFGGDGAAGGGGGAGGGVHNTPSAPPPGSGGDGGNGGNGGATANGGDAIGSAIYSETTHAATDAATTFSSNTVVAVRGIAFHPDPYAGGAAGPAGGGGPGGWGGPAGTQQGSGGAAGLAGSTGARGADGQALDPNIHVYALKARFRWQDNSCAVCSSSSTEQLDATVSTSSDGIASFKWTFDDGTTASGATVTHVWPDRDPHHVTLEITDSGGHHAGVAADIAPCSGDTDPNATNAATAADAGAADRRNARAARSRGHALVAGACPIVVNDARDLANAKAGDVNCDVDANQSGSQCTLRAAIEAANARGGAISPISFALPGGGHVIAPVSPLPAILVPVAIDGTTQPNGAKVTLDGSRLPGGGQDGLILGGGSSSVRGLAIGGFTRYGLLLEGGSGNTIAGNDVGMDASGLHAAPNGIGMRIEDSGANVVGGTAAVDQNVISGNLGDGVQIVGNNATNNRVAGNLIGVSSNHNLAGNLGDGVKVVHATNNTIGGTRVQGNNVIAANLGNGVELLALARDNHVQGNFVGTDPLQSGFSLALGNGNNGIYVHHGVQTEPDRNIVGGSEPGTGNVVDSNRLDGILVQHSDANVVEGNDVALNRGGIATTVLGNDGNGIHVLDARDTRVGGRGSGDGNHIGGGGLDGVLLDSATGTLVQGNVISNNFFGILALLGSHANRITANVITGSHEAAVRIDGKASSTNRITDNSMARNRFGIDLVTDGGRSGTVPYDLADTDNGGNQFQELPVLASFSRGAKGYELVGAIASQPRTRYEIEVFVSSTCNASGYGEGERIVTSLGVRPQDSSAVFRIHLPAGAVAGARVLTATATDPQGNTSEFSNCLHLGELSNQRAVDTELNANLKSAGHQLAHDTPATIDGGPTVSFDALGPGTLDLQLSDAGLTAAVGRRGVVLARAHRSVRTPGHYRMRLTVTPQGHRLLAAARRGHVTLWATFKPRHGRARHASRRISLRRRR